LNSCLSPFPHLIRSSNASDTSLIENMVHTKTFPEHIPKKSDRLKSTFGKTILFVSFTGNSKLVER